MKLPNLIIGGVYKAGTTSLFTYLARHSNIFGSPIKEIHYYTPLIFNRTIEPIGSYAAFFERAGNQQYRLEASPGYMYAKKDLVDKMFTELDNPKFIFILRDPVERFISYYRHLHARYDIPDVPFEQFYQKAWHTYNENVELDDTDVYTLAIREGMYCDYLSTWMENYAEHVNVVFFEDLVANTRPFLFKLANWLGIDQKEFETINLTIENETFYSKNKQFFLLSRNINRRFEGFFRRNPGVKDKIRKIYRLLNAKKQTRKKDIPDEMKEELMQLYKPGIVTLRSLLEKYGYNDFPDWFNSM